MCKCKSFTLTWDLHVIYTTIDIYMHNTLALLVNIFFWWTGAKFYLLLGRHNHHNKRFYLIHCCCDRLVCQFASNHTWVFAKFLCVSVEFSTNLIIFLNLVAINAKFFCKIIATHAISFWGWLPPMLHPKNENKKGVSHCGLAICIKNIS